MVSNVDLDVVDARKKVWDMAEEMISPIIEKHGLELYSTSGSLISASGVWTPVDQHLNHIFTLAEWLVNDNAE